jgi:hypothetical protein
MKKSAALEGEIIKPGEDLPAVPPLLPGRPASLKTANGILREMGTCYRAARSGNLDVQTACRLVYILQGMAKVFEIHEFENRIAALEEKRK